MNLNKYLFKRKVLRGSCDVPVTSTGRAACHKRPSSARKIELAKHESHPVTILSAPTVLGPEIATVEHEAVTGADDSTQAAREKEVVCGAIIEGGKKILEIYNANIALLFCGLHYLYIYS